MHPLVAIKQTKFWHATIVLVAVGIAVAAYWNVVVGIGAGAAILAFGLVGPAGVGRVSEAALLDRPATAVARAEWAWVPIVARYGVFSAPGFYVVIRLADVFAGRSAVQALAAVAAFAFIEVVKVIDLDGDRVDDILAARGRKLIQDHYVGQFEPHGPLPKEGPVGLSDVYLAVQGDDRHGGWGADGRATRAQDIQRWIDSQPDAIAWVPPSDLQQV